MRRLAQLVVAGAALAVAGQTPQAFATSSSVVYNVEGNPGCKQILTNSIKELKSTSIVVDFPSTLASGTQSITYTVSGDGDSIEEWSSSQPVNAVVIKKSGNAGSVIYHFGQAGVTEDTDEPADAGIAGIAFCYGLTGTTVEEDAYAACPSGLQDALDQLGEQLVVVGIENGNTQGKPFQCVSQGGQVSSCSYLTNQDDSCDDGGLFAPQSIDFYEGSTTSCNTSGGKVKCNTVNWP
jgi:hypothetical protein